MPHAPVDARAQTPESFDRCWLLSLPGELQTLILKHSLANLNPRQRQAFRLGALSRLNKALRSVAESIDADLMVVIGAQSFLSFDQARAVEVEPLEAEVTFECRNEQGEIALRWNEGQALRLAAPVDGNSADDALPYDETVLSRLSCFVSLRHFTVRCLSMRAEPQDDDDNLWEYEPGNSITSVFAKLPFLDQLTTFHYTNEWEADPEMVWALWSTCSKVTELTLDQTSDIYVSCGRYGINGSKVPKAPAALLILNTGEYGSRIVEVVLYHAASASCLVRCHNIGHIICSHYYEPDPVGNQHYPACFALRALSLRWLPWSTKDERHDWPNVTHLECAHFVLLNDNSFWQGFPALRWLTLGKDGYTTDTPHATRERLIEMMRLAPRGVHVHKLSIGWATGEKLALEEACRRAEVQLEWFDDWDAIDHL